MASFAWWTLLYHLALASGLSATVAWWAWAAGTAALVTIRVRTSARFVPLARRVGNGWALLVAVLLAGLSSVVVRPDLDDASYTVRSTWVAQRGVLGAGDIIFSDGRWSGLPEQTPYLPSFESFWGMTARVVGLSPGSLVYGVYVPLATFAAVWSLWTLLRAWRTRQPVAALVLACVFLLWGGAVHASWGNLHLARIWQGKVTLLAVLVPLAYAWAARYWAARDRGQRWAFLVLMGLLGAAATGLSPAGVFVIPGVVAVAATAGALVGRRGRAALLLVVGSAYPLVCGVVMRLHGRTAEAIPGSTAVGPWERTLGTGLLMAVVLVAGAAALLALVPGAARCRSRVGTLTAAVSVVLGLVLALPPVTAAAVAIMGTDAIAWRVVWVVPVPALVGLLAAPMRRGPSWLAGVGGLAVGLTLVLGGIPLWSAVNRATVSAPGAWKMDAADLLTATWIVDDASGGRYLAREQVVAAVGTMTADRAPVGSRPGYMEPYLGVAGAYGPERVLLQRWVDGVAQPEQDGSVKQALRVLDVRVVCGPSAVGEGLGPGWRAVWHGGADVCWTRG